MVFGIRFVDEMQEDAGDDPVFQGAENGAGDFVEQTHQRDFHQSFEEFAQQYDADPDGDEDEKERNIPNDFRSGMQYGAYFRGDHIGEFQTGVKPEEEGTQVCNLIHEAVQESPDQSDQQNDKQYSVEYVHGLKIRD